MVFRTNTWKLADVVAVQPQLLQIDQLFDAVRDAFQVITAHIQLHQ